MVSFGNIFQSTDEKLEELVNEFREEFGTVLDYLICNLNNLEEIGYSALLIDISKRAYPPYFDADDLFSFDKEVIAGGETKKIRKYKAKMNFRNLARNNLVSWTSKGPMARLMEGIFERYRSAYIEYAHFSNLYFFLERIYYVNINRKLEFQDLINIYFSDLDKLITFNLDEFDTEDLTTKPTTEFFKKIDKIKYPEQNVLDFQYKIREIIRSVLSRNYGNFESFGRIEEEFLSYLAGCCAVKHNRNQITIEDYLTAHKTYYKLLKTDVTQYKAKPEVLKELGLELPSQDEQGGYIACDKCGGYYQLQPGESPDDFSDTCECGGKLEFKETLESDDPT